MNLLILLFISCVFCEQCTELYVKIDGMGWGQAFKITGNNTVLFPVKIGIKYQLQCKTCAGVNIDDTLLKNDAAADYRNVSCATKGKYWCDGTNKPTLFLYIPECKLHAVFYPENQLKRELNVSYSELEDHVFKIKIEVNIFSDGPEKIEVFYDGEIVNMNDTRFVYESESHHEWTILTLILSKLTYDDLGYSTIMIKSNLSNSISLRLGISPEDRNFIVGGYKCENETIDIVCEKSSPADNRLSVLTIYDGKARFITSDDTFKTSISTRQSPPLGIYYTCLREDTYTVRIPNCEGSGTKCWEHKTKQYYARVTPNCASHTCLGWNDVDYIFLHNNTMVKLCVPVDIFVSVQIQDANGMRYVMREDYTLIGDAAENHKKLFEQFYLYYTRTNERGETFITIKSYRRLPFAVDVEYFNVKKRYYVDFVKFLTHSSGKSEKTRKAESYKEHDMRKDQGLLGAVVILIMMSAMVVFATAWCKKQCKNMYIRHTV